MKINKMNLLKIVLIIIIVVWSIIPLYYITVSAFMWASDITQRPPQFVPVNPTFSTILRVLGFSAPGPTGEMLRPAGYPVVKGIYNSFTVAFPVMLITMIISLPAGYVLGRFQLPKKNLWLGLILGTRTLPPVGIVIPYYIWYNFIGLYGSILGLIIAHCCITIPLLTWVLMGFFATLPRELEKAARLDGLNATGAFLKVILRVSLPAVSVCAIIAFLTSWNEFLMALILTTGTPAQTLPPVLATMFAQNIGLDVFAAANLLAAIPAILVSLVLQKYITQLKIVDPLTVVV
jgi:multiple sugar transport system permease protein